MKLMEKLRVVILGLLAVCVLCAVAAFFLPNAHGMILSYVAIAVAVVVALLCAAAAFALYSGNNHSAAV